MRLATAPINWNNEDVRDYRPWVPFPAILDEIAAAGYDVTEWSSSLPTSAAELGPELDRRGLTLLGAFAGLDLRDRTGHDRQLDLALGHARFLHGLGARYLVASDAGDAARRAAAGHAGDAPGLSDGELGALAAGLERLATELRDLGMELVFHPHVGTYVETPEEIDRLFARTDAELVGWCLDTGHQVYGGARDLASLVRAHLDRVRYVHVKDVDGEVLERARSGGWGFSEALRRFVFCPVGDGIVPLAEVLGDLAGHGYDGWLVVEQDTTDRDPTITARHNREALERMLGGS